MKIGGPINDTAITRSILTELTRHRLNLTGPDAQSLLFNCVLFAELEAIKRWFLGFPLFD